MEEYKRLYEMYIEKTNDELLEIINHKSEYTEIASQVATDILEKERRMELPEMVIETVESEPEKQPTHKPVVIVICIISAFIAIAVLISGFSDLLHYSKLKETPNNSIVGNYYDGSGDYFGIIFYFIDDNTYCYSTSSGDTIAYGTYDISGNSLTLKVSSETYAAVITEDGNKIMINDSALKKTTDTNLITHYKEMFTNAD